MAYAEHEAPSCIPRRDGVSLHLEQVAQLFMRPAHAYATIHRRLGHSEYPKPSVNQTSCPLEGRRQDVRPRRTQRPRAPTPTARGAALGSPGRALHSPVPHLYRLAPVLRALPPLVVVGDAATGLLAAHALGNGAAPVINAVLHAPGSPGDGLNITRCTHGQPP